MEKDRQEICEAISEMLDNPDASGIYPTTKCFDRLELYMKKLRKKASLSRLPDKDYYENRLFHDLPISED